MDAAKERVTKLFLSFVSDHWRKLLLPIAAIAVVAAILLIPHGQADDEAIVVSELNPLAELLEENHEAEQDTEGDAAGSTLIVVDVKGAVHHPGVYTLEEGDRLGDAIQAAGGYVEDADSRMLNHAQKLSDELLIYVPVKGEELPDSSLNAVQGGTAAPATDGKVNLNTADEGQLTTIPGIGPAKAQAIIQHRDEHGPFNSIESLMDVSGIGKKTFEKLEHQITVN